MKIEAIKLIDDLTERTSKHIKAAEHFKSYDEDVLNSKQTPHTWSVLECIEHLNLYGQFYIPEITRAVNKNPAASRKYFKSGVIGNYFAQSMLPGKKMKKIKTFKDKNPNGKLLNIEVLNEFLSQQGQVLRLLDQCKSIDLTRAKTAISITRLLKLRLGDTLRVVIYHNGRHIKQAEKALKRANKEK